LRERGPCFCASCFFFFVFFFFFFFFPVFPSAVRMFTGVDGRERGEERGMVGEVVACQHGSLRFAEDEECQRDK